MINIENQTQKCGNFLFNITVKLIWLNLSIVEMQQVEKMVKRKIFLIPICKNSFYHRKFALNVGL